MPRKNIWLNEQGLLDLAALKERWGTTEGETIRKALALAIKSKK